MYKVLHIVKCLVVIAVAAVWFQNAAHTVICHTDNALCGHDGCSESTVCSCICHAAYEPVDDAPVCVDRVETAFVPSPDETIRALLLPNDIFRPPLTNS